MLLTELFVHLNLGLMHFMHTDPKTGADLVIESLRTRLHVKDLREYKVQVNWVLVIASCFVDHRLWSSIAIV